MVQRKRQLVRFHLDNGKGDAVARLVRLRGNDRHAHFKAVNDPAAGGARDAVVGCCPGQGRHGRGRFKLLVFDLAGRGEQVTLAHDVDIIA